MIGNLGVMAERAGRRSRGLGLLGRRPEVLPVTATVVAWILLAGGTPPTAWFGVGGTGFAGPAPAGEHTMQGVFTASGLLMVTLMTVAMMGPMAIPGARTVAFTSLWWRAGRATGWFFVAFTLSWTAVAVCLATVAELLVGLLPTPATATGIVLLLCALAQLDPRRTDRSKACDRPMRLRSNGSDANVDCARFGVLTAYRGLWLCALPMLAMLTLPASLLMMALLTTLSVTDRVTEGRRRLLIAALYAGLGAVLIL